MLACCTHWLVAEQRYLIALVIGYIVKNSHPNCFVFQFCLSISRAMIRVCVYLLCTRVCTDCREKFAFEPCDIVR